MLTRWISAFALAGALFALDTTPSLKVDSKAGASTQRSTIDFCCLAGLSCCYIPPVPRTRSTGEDTLPTINAQSVRLH